MTGMIFGITFTQYKIVHFKISNDARGFNEDAAKQRTGISG